MVEQSHPEEALEERTGIGLHGMDLHHLPKETIFAWMLLHDMFPDYRQKLEKINVCIESLNMKEGRADKQRTKLFSEQEFIVRFGLLIAAAGVGDNGKELWLGDKKDVSAWESTHLICLMMAFRSSIQ